MKNKKGQIINGKQLWKEDTFLFAVFMFPSILVGCWILSLIQVFVLER